MPEVDFLKCPACGEHAEFIADGRYINCTYCNRVSSADFLISLMCPSCDKDKLNKHIKKDCLICNTCGFIAKRVDSGYMGKGKPPPDIHKLCEELKEVLYDVRRKIRGCGYSIDLLGHSLYGSKIGFHGFIALGVATVSTSGKHHGLNPQKGAISTYQESRRCFGQKDTKYAHDATLRGLYRILIRKEEDMGEGVVFSGGFLPSYCHKCSSQLLTSHSNFREAYCEKCEVIYRAMEPMELNKVGEEMEEVEKESDDFVVCWKPKTGTQVVKDQQKMQEMLWNTIEASTESFGDEEIILYTEDRRMLHAMSLMFDEAWPDEKENPYRVIRLALIKNGTIILYKKTS